MKNIFEKKNRKDFRKIHNYLYTNNFFFRLLVVIDTETDKTENLRNPVKRPGGV